MDRWDIGLVDIAGDQGLLAQVNGRNSTTVIGWLHQRNEQWWRQITHVTIDLSGVYAKAVREALPNAEIIVDRFYSDVRVMPTWSVSHRSTHDRCPVSGQVSHLAFPCRVSSMPRTTTRSGSISRIGSAVTTTAVWQKVLDHIEAFPGSQYTIGDLAVIAGVGARQLQNLFQEQFGMSPTTYIRQIRLDGVRADLQRGDEATKVSDVAFNWGFNHLGRFANHYERKFGETPSQTLRAARR